ncbi:MAG: glycosyltransferase family 4 protein [Euryarchaeota archaeon]|nr:glycosyltransferase family 4 protein [Euryarchaeota archaeon]MBU4608127.1 glycosyltransferase family 4 protein [Euryarchaeota archaeon]MBV1728963.1 glycosyltransferase family 4 protein [Methanobacterium sp.]MBV1755624.1 glycosyltransferase family 4 protein [Methanobacterium sp.]
MKIAIVSDFFIPHYQGGGERRYFEIAKRLVAQGHKVDVICMKIEDTENHEIIDGINVYHIGPVIKNPPHRSSGDFMRFILATFRWIIQHNYDVIDAQTYAPLFPSFLAGKLKRIPVVATIHDISSGGDDQWIQSSKTAAMVEKFLCRLPYDKIITVSNATKKSLIENYGTNENRIEVVYNGVDLELIDSLKTSNKQENTLIFVGRLAPHKHVDHLLKVINSLKTQINDIQLVIVGKGIEKENLINLTLQMNLQHHVKFLDNLSYEELIREIKKSSVLVLPSTREGFGMVLAEAGACKIPVVAYASGGVLEVVEDGYNGFLVEPYDLDGLGNKIRFIFENHFKSTKLGLNGYEKVQRYFIWDNILKSILSVYKNF